MFKCGQKCANISREVFLISDVCLLPKKPGNCFAYITRYYFDYSAQDCVEFVYGGCDANANNFETREACLSTCDSLRTAGKFFTKFVIISCNRSTEPQIKSKPPYFFHPFRILSCGQMMENVLS